MKKRKLMNRVAAVLCAVMVSFGICDAFYADDVYVVSPFYDESAESLFNSRSAYTVFRYMERDIILCYNGYSYKSFSWGNEINCTKVGVLSLKGGAWDDVKSGTGDGLMGSAAYSYFTDLDSSINSSKILDYILYSSIEIKDPDGNVLCPVGYNPNFDYGETYNNSLGYLQNVNRQTLYLEDDAFALVEDTLKYQFTFDKTTTTGLDVTDGSWSVRHYMQVEVKNAKKEYETVDIYDKVLMGQYPAASCKIGYMYKESLEKLHGESGFDGLSWWESNGLGYITYYNDYFQLVRTNSDGTVEYGGYVKVWQDEYNINHSVTLGEDERPDNNGYNDNIVSGSHGSGGTYEDAEHDANENASNAADSNSEFTEQLNDMVSMVSAVPQLFGAMFSFLPDWCLNFLAAGVGFSVILLIWKSARG